MQSIKISFLKNLATAGGFVYLIQILRFIGTMILSRILMPVEYGIIGMIQVFSAFLIIFRNIGFGSVIIREKKISMASMETMHFITFCIGVLQCLLLVSLSRIISDFYSRPELILPTCILATSFILNSLVVIPTSVLRRNQNFKRLGTVEFISATLGLLVAIVAAQLGYSFWSLVFQELLQAIVMLILLARIVKVRIPYSREIKGALFKNKTILTHSIGFGVISYASRNVDSMLVGRIFGSAKLGIYNRGYSLLYMARILFSSILSKVLLPSLSQIADNKKALGDFSIYLVNLSIAAMLPVAIIFSLVPKWFVTTIWGESWLEVSDILKYFGILLLIDAPVNISNDILIARRKEKFILPMIIINALITVSVIALSVPLGIEQLAKYITLSSIFLNTPVVLYFLYFKTLDQSIWQISKLWIPFIAALGMLVFSDSFKISAILFGILIVKQVVFFRGDIHKVWKKMSDYFQR
jgi:teichuronic acid exporter